MIGSGGVYGSTTKPLVNHETIVIGRKGSAGSVYYSPTPCHPSDTTFYLVWKEEVHVPFVYNFLLFKGIAPDRSVIPSLQRGDVESIVIPFPPLPEQCAIAHVLRAVQAAREARQREVSLERERKAALMAHLFTHGTRGESTKQTPIGEMPVSWKVVRLGEVCVFTTGKLNSEASVDGGKYPFFTCSPNTLRIDSFSFDQETILLAGNNAQAIYSVKYYAGKFDAYQRTYVITISASDRMTYRYLLYEMSLSLESLRRQSLGATTRYLTASIISSLPLRQPPIEEQKRIADVLTACDAKIAALERESALLDELFRVLLEELMTGRVAVAGIEEDNG